MRCCRVIRTVYDLSALLVPLLLMVLVLRVPYSIILLLLRRLPISISILLS